MKKNGIKILVVDDDEIVREVIISLLSSEGYTVRSAKDGLDAIKILKMENINLVITDLRMPGADGIEVLKEAIKNGPGSGGDYPDGLWDPGYGLEGHPGRGL